MRNYVKFVWIVIMGLLCFGYEQKIVSADVFPDSDILAKIKYLTFIKPIDRAPKRDTFKYKDTAEITGKIAYTPLGAGRDNQTGAITRYIVIRTLQKGKETSVQALPVQTSANIYGFQFSPDGKNLLFKIGTPFTDPADPYDIAFWNLSTDKVSVVPDNPHNYEIAFYRIRWSPSGRYIAYCRGGDVNGNEYPFPNDYRPLRLYTYDLVTKKEHFIVKSPTVRQFTWTKDDTLLFSMTAKEYAKRQNKPVKESDERSDLLNIYQSLPTGEKITLLIKDGFAVYPSPDGTKYVFMSHEDIDERQHRKEYEAPSEHDYVHYSHPIFYNSKTNTFKALDLEEEYPQEVLWMPDGKKLLIAQYDYQTGNKGVLDVYQLGLSKMKQKQVAQFEVQDQSYFSGSISYHQFDKLSLSKDQLYLAVKSIRYGEILHNKYRKYPDRYESIKIAHMNDGKVFTLCTLHRFGDIGWYNLH